MDAKTPLPAKGEGLVRATHRGRVYWQQNSVEPALPATPVLQVNDESVWSGVSEPTHENPYDPAWQPLTVLSSAHVPRKVSPVRQQ